MSGKGGIAWVGNVIGRVAKRSLFGFVILAGLAVHLSSNLSSWVGDHRKLQKDAEGPRVAVCFYGLTRSLQWTLPSIKNRLIDVLRDHDLKVDVFVHTFVLEKVSANESARFSEPNVSAVNAVTESYRTARGRKIKIPPEASEVLRRFSFEGAMIYLLRLSVSTILHLELALYCKPAFLAKSEPITSQLGCTSCRAGEQRTGRRGGHSIWSPWGGFPTSECHKVNQSWPSETYSGGCSFFSLRYPFRWVCRVLMPDVYPNERFNMEGESRSSLRRELLSSGLKNR